MLGLESEFRRRGVTSLSHESYQWDGSLLGAYGAAVRGKEQAGYLAVQQLYGTGAGAGAGAGGDEGDGEGEIVSRDSGAGGGSGDSGAGGGSGDSGAGGGSRVSGAGGGSGYIQECAEAIANAIAHRNVASFPPPPLPPSSPPPSSSSTPRTKRKRIEVKEQGWAKKNHNMHIPRQTLRQLLLEPLLPDCILWNKHFVRYEECDGGDDDDEEGQGQKQGQGQGQEEGTELETGGLESVSATTNTISSCGSSSSGSSNTTTATTTITSRADTIVAGREQHVTSRHVKVYFSDGQVVKAAAVVAADGIYRWVFDC